MSALEALQRSTLFREFTDAGLRIFAAIALEKAIPAGTSLFAENGMGESLFIVKSGTVRITVSTAEGEKELAVVGPGEHLGALGLLAKSTRLVSAIAATRCEVLEITQRDFLRIHPQKPQACLKLALAIAQDVARKAEENRDALRAMAARPPDA